MSKEIVFFILGVGYAFVCLTALFGIPEIYGGNLVIELNDEIEISCDSESMRPAIHCFDEIEAESIDDDHKFRVGAIYIFKQKDGLTMHRLVGCADKPRDTFPVGNNLAYCEVFIMKGDNNIGVELVERNDVIKVVTSQKYWWGEVGQE